VNLVTHGGEEIGCKVGMQCLDKKCYCTEPKEKAQDQSARRQKALKAEEMLKLACVAYYKSG